MLKKICFSWIICILFSQQVLCGVGSSIPIDENKEKAPVKPLQKPQNPSSKIDFEKIALKSNPKPSESSSEGASSQEELIQYVTEGNRNYPAIDLSYDDFREGIILSPQSSKLDLHPVYNKDFTSFLVNKIFELQMDYHFSKIPDNKVFIITGTGKARPGPNFRLKKAVINLLQTQEFFKRRLQHCNLFPGKGLISVHLRKDLEPLPSDKRGTVMILPSQVMGVEPPAADWHINLKSVDFSEGMNLYSQYIDINIFSYLNRELNMICEFSNKISELAHLRDQLTKMSSTQFKVREDVKVRILTSAKKKSLESNAVLKKRVIKLLEGERFQHLIAGHEDDPTGIIVILRK